jgi:predicted alpha-1,2-mannosidase
MRLVTIWVIATAGLAADPASLVNPFVGTGLSPVNDYGKTNPGAVRPFGMLYWGPDPAEDVFYRADDRVVRGFGITHISGPGCGQYGDAPVLPVVGVPSVSPAVVQPRVWIREDTAEPGYYAATLDSGIRVRLAAQVRSGIAEFDFPAKAPSRTILLDLGRNLGPAVSHSGVKILGRSLTGSVESGGLCGSGNRYRVSVAFEFEREPDAWGVYDKSGIRPSVTDLSGKYAGAYVTFRAGSGPVRLRVGMSFVGVENAVANLREEIPGWNFEHVRSQARAAWNETLGRVEISGGTHRDRRVFYTALYHAVLHPSIFSDVNGEYIGFDERVRTAKGRTHYSNFSGWDMYRSQAQLLAMLFPDEASDMAQSLVADAEQSGGLPVWAAANDDAATMVGDPSACILAAFYAFGARKFDTKRALEFMLRGADDPQARSRRYLQRPDLAEYLDRGWIAERGIPGRGAASVTLEYQTADFAIARFAAALGDEKNARRLEERARQWRKLFDPETRYIRPRGEDGRFLPGFDPAKTSGFVEGNAAQYTWMVAWDLPGLIDAIGGPASARDRLDHYFSRYADLDAGGPYFAMWNEPSFGSPWIYNWTGHPWRTQEVVRKSLTDLFTDEPSGLPGNDDLGATSSWVVFAQLGIYPEIPGVGGLTLNTPTFPEARLHCGRRVLRISAPGAPEKKYVEHVTLNGQPVRNWWLEWDALGSHARLDFKLAQ